MTALPPMHFSFPQEWKRAQSQSSSGRVGQVMLRVFRAINSLSYPLMLVAEHRVFAMVLVFACQSTIGAQMALHGIWCVLAPLHWGKRFLVGATAGLVLYAGVALGWTIGRLFRGWSAEVDWDPHVTVLLCLPLFSLATQTPLWAMRIWFRWRIVRRDEIPSATFRPLRIGDLLVATAVVAMSLAAVRISQSINDSSGNDTIVGLTIAALVVMVISAITILPVVLATLYARRLLMALALALAGDAAVIVVYVALMVIIGGARLGWEVFVGMPILAAVYFASLTGPMLIARRLGYRLLCGFGQPPSDSPA
jgi:hypothetical protein